MPTTLLSRVYLSVLEMEVLVGFDMYHRLEEAEA